MKIKVNERWMDFSEGADLWELKSMVMPDSDVIIINGFQTGENIFLRDGDIVSLIKKGRIPSDNEMEHLLISRHTPGIHEKLKKSRVAVAGLGGLGSNIAVNLARMGIGVLRLVDYDVVEPSNLNRQQYFINQIGEKKTNALVNTLKQINPYVCYEPVNVYITSKNIKDILSDFDVIIEAFDSAENKAILINNCIKLFPDSCIIGASGVAGIHPASQIGVRQIGKNTYIVGDMEHEAKPGQGLMATRVAVAAGIQSNIAVRFLTGEL